jgi:hypothetical protein
MTPLDPVLIPVLKHFEALAHFLRSHNLLAALCYTDILYHAICIELKLRLRVPVFPVYPFLRMEMKPKRCFSTLEAMKGLVESLTRFLSINPAQRVSG